MRSWSDEKLNGQVEGLLAWARRIGETEEVQPVAFVFACLPGIGDGFVGVQPRGLEFGREGKDEFSATIRSLVHEVDADAVLFICEAWCVMTDEGSAESAVRLSEDGRLSEHPDRIETVHAILETSDGKRAMFVSRIDGVIPRRTLSEYERTDGGETGGRFANFFDRGGGDSRGRRTMEGMGFDLAPFVDDGWSSDSRDN